MDFKVYTDADGAYDEYSGEHVRFELAREGGGVLYAWRDAQKVIYGPTGWLRVELQDPELARHSW